MLSDKINHSDLEPIIRPPPGPVTRKAARPIAPLAEQTGGDDLEEVVLPESDGSRASDSDFAPPQDSNSATDSESESVHLSDEIFMVRDSY